jgi:tRNA nucleotidyltransferase (CCA-adding enzyme)
MTSLEEVLREAYKLAVLSEKEVREVTETARSAKALVADIVSSAGISAEVDVYGSSARLTWIPGHPDVDVFVVLENKDVKPESVVRALSEGLTSRGIKWRLRYAQHPFITLSAGWCEVDVVPCYKINPGERPITAADRSPLHHKFLAERLNDELRRDIRLLKIFMRTVGVYGAEIKVEGFSGYLAELLVTYYGSFLEVLKAAALWRPYRVRIDPSGRSAAEKFKAPLVVVDPVDPDRNAAAAVSLASMSTFILASRRFLKRPSLSYFLPRQGHAVRHLSVVEVIFPYPGEPPDIVWGKYKRAGRALREQLRECGFRVYRWGVESDEKTHVSLVYVVDQTELPPFVLHRGPPVYSDDVDKFIEKYVAEDVVGPFVDGVRVYVIKRRRYVSVMECISGKLGAGNYTIRVNAYEGTLVQKNAWIT